MQIKSILIGILLLGILWNCAPEDSIKYPNFTPYLIYEDFLGNTEDGLDINIAGWTNFAQTGSVKWKQGIYSGTKYAQFSGYQSEEYSNIGWLISPPINMNQYDHEKLAFDVAQAYVSSAANSIELLISTNFDGENVLDATWESKTFTKPPLEYDSNYDFFSSGIIDLSQYTGIIYIAFKVKGSGTDTNLDGTYAIDNIRVFNKI